MAETRREIDVQKVAALARLTLEPAEAERFRPQLARVLEFIAQLDELDTRAVEPTSHVVPVATPLRSDTTREGLDRDEVLAQAPQTMEGAFVVPKFVEGG
jgi:aspartyl-tRNA(Asn)/glutamyl-tRNA(Gln) amidotransferase subunit C